MLFEKKNVYKYIFKTNTVGLQIRTSLKIFTYFRISLEF